MDSQGWLGLHRLFYAYSSPQALVIAVIAACAVMGLTFWFLDYNNRRKEQKRKGQEDDRKKKDKKNTQKGGQQKKKNKPTKPQPKAEKENPLLMTTIKGHEREVTAIAFNPRGTYLASFSKDRTLRLFAVSTLTEKEIKHQRINLDLDHGEWAAFSADGRYLITVMSDTKHVRIYDMKKEQGKYTAKAVKEFSTPHKEELNTLAMAPNSKYILSCSNDESLILWSVPQATILEHMNVKKGRNHMASISPDAKYFALATATGEVVIWEVTSKKGDTWEFEKTKKITALPNGHRTVVRAVCYSPDGHYLLTGSDDCTWRLWDVNVRYALSEDPRCIHNVQMKKPVENVSFSPDGETVLIFSDGTLHFFAAKTGKPMASIPYPHQGNKIVSFSWSPNSAYLATAASQDKGIKVWRNPAKQK